MKPSPPSINDVDATQIAQELGRLVSDGVPIVDAIESDAVDNSDSSSANALARLAKEIRSGGSLEDVLNEGGFPRDVFAILSAAIQSGRPAETLSDFFDLRSRFRALRVHCFSSLIYPVMLAVSSLVVVIVLITLVSPGVVDLVDGFALDLPWPTRFCFAVSDWMRRFGWWMLLAAVSIPILLLFGRRMAAWIGIPLRTSVSEIGLSIPPFTKLDHHLATAHFCHLLARLLRQSIPMPDALRLAGTAGGHPWIQYAATRTADFVQGGGQLDASSTAWLPETVSHVLAETSGSEACAEILHSLGEMYAARAEIWIRVVANVVGTLAILAVSGMVVAVIASYFLPLVSLIQNLS